jgi:menaquinol-cytochrome c reductase iron-sulfur subunit
MEQVISVETTTACRRRRFMVSAIYAFPALIGGTLLFSIAAYLFSGSKTDALAWGDAGDVSGLTKGAPQRVSFTRTVTDGWKTRNEKSDAWVILSEKQQVIAFSPLCTHLGCAYSWESDKKAFGCPCHGSLFRADGSVARGPADRPLDRFEVKLEGSRLWLGAIKKDKAV